MIDLIIGILSFVAGFYAIAVTARSMRRKRHGVALQIMSIGLGLNGIAMMALASGSPEDVTMTYSGDALLAIGFWIIILTRRHDDADPAK